MTAHDSFERGDGPLSSEWTTLSDDLEKKAALWSALMADVNAMPCKWPCLRDDLADWLKAKGDP